MVAVHIKGLDPEWPHLLPNERLIYSLLGLSSPHPRIAQCLNTNLYSLPAETRVQVAETEPLRLAVAPNGDVEQYLFRHPGVSQHQRATWGKQIAEGIAYLHSHNIVWGDCCPANMLLTADLDVLLCDFGGSSMPGARKNSVAPPIQYCDPALDFSYNFSGDRKIDIFAFGCVFLEILTCNADTVAAGWQPVLYRGGRAFNSQKLLIDTVVFDPFKLIVENCWDGSYADGTQLFVAVNDAWVQFQQAEKC
ncbi:kinase-like domain-containing protein [Mycena belliarum]|uniref:Kinase-like domain-containing protein n=1 Tax=Mycena belliarum TaxID=1033014 RepID=A0AAD6TQH6_9AGAR|nr:kinase-like domain-containing protein [Mycena belliae]